MPAAVNRLTAAGKAARRRKATIYRDFPAAADRFAHRGKPKTAAADKHFVVVILASCMMHAWYGHYAQAEINRCVLCFLDETT